MKKLIILAINALIYAISCPIFAQLPANSVDISPLLIGETIPDVTITDTKGNAQSMLSLTKEKPTVIFFYRGDWCSNCITHFTEEIAPNLPEILKLGYNLILISPDSPEKLLVTSGKTKIDPQYFFSDGEGALSKGMGIAFQQQERMLAMLLESSGGKNKGYLPVPGVFVVGIDQKIMFEYINPNGPQSALRIRGKLLMAVLQALKA